MARRLTIADIFPGKGRKPVRVESRLAPTGSFSLDCDQRAECDRVEIDLSYPPATNNLYFNAPGKGRVKTERYAGWLDESGWRIAAQRPGRIVGPFATEITVTRPDNRRRDLDNMLKPILDCLVKHRVIPDDSLGQRHTIQWANDGDGVRVVVTRARGRE